jgi:arylsulfatase A-like enzyme
VPAREPSVIREHQSGPGNVRTYPVRLWGGPEDGRWRQYLWAYYRMVEAVDVQIARVLGSLRAAGHEENTVVLFFSDHGDGMGAHRWNQKTLFYEEIVRVPLIVSWPGHTVPAGRERRRLVNLGTDLAATVLDFAGVAQPPGLRGASVKSFALGTCDGPAPEYVVSETNLHRAYGVEGEHHGRMVRSARYKYVCYNAGMNPEQLFDLDLDPGEMTSLVGDPAHADVLQRHRAMLRHYCTTTGDFFPVGRRPEPAGV